MYAATLARLKNQKLELILLLVLPLLVILWRLPLAEKPLDDDSAANAYGARLILEGEPLYSSYHPGHHLPAIYYTYALAFALVGDSPAAIRFFLSLWLIPTTYLLYRLARTYADRKTGWLAVIFFLLLTSDYALEGYTVEIEQFVNLLRIGATLLLITLLNRNAKDWQFVWIGLIAAVCLLFKAVYVSPLALTGLALLGQFWARRNEPDAVGRLVRRTIWVGGGLLLGLLPVVVYFGALGLLPRLGLVFTLGQRHVSAALVNPLFILLFPITGLTIANLPLLILGLSGGLLMPLDKSLPPLPRRLIPLWLLLSFVEAGISRNAFPHYYLLITPPLSLLAAWLVTQLYRLAQLKLKFKPVVWAVPTLLLLAVGGVYLFINGGYLNHYFRYKTGQETFRDFVLYSWPPTGEMFVALQDIADYVQAHSQADDRIYIWSEEVQLYYLANRRCALDFIWVIYLENPAIPGGPAEMQRRLFAPTTKFIIIAQDNPPVWLTDGLAKDYRLVQTISGREIYQRVGS
jgi:hypothetical protein